LAILGLLGYPALLIGVLVALLGAADLDTGWGTVFFVPGGVFELVLPFVLFVRGFSVGTADRTLVDRRVRTNR
jgi:hypothetical protein